MNLNLNKASIHFQLAIQTQRVHRCQKRLRERSQILLQG
jgi:hypothetical protein